VAITDLINKIILQDEFSKAFDDYGKRLKDAEGGTQRLNATLRGLAGIGAAVGGGLVVANAAVDELTDKAVENERAMFNVSYAAAAANKEFGDGVGTTESWVASVGEMSDKLRVFGDQDVANATARLIDMTKRLGFSEEQMRTVLERTADLSAGKVDLTGGIERTTAALRGEAEAAEFLGLSLNEMTVMAYAEAQGLVWSKLTDLEKAQLRYNLLLLQTDQLQGRAAASAETIAGQEAELARLRERTITEIGQSLLPLRQGELALYQKLTDSQLPLKNAITGAFAAAVGAAVTFGAALQKVITLTGAFASDLGKIGQALQDRDWGALLELGEIFGESRKRAEELAGIVSNLPGVWQEATRQAYEGFKQSEQAQVDLQNAVADTTGSLTQQGGIAGQVADEIAKEYDKAMASRAQATRNANRQIADLEYDHAQRVIRIQQDIARATAEAAAEAIAARAAADRKLAEGLVDIERGLQQERARAAADFHRELDRLRQDRRDAERETAREIQEIERDLQQELADLQRDTAQELADLERERGQDIAEVNQELADDLADDAYKAQQDRLAILRDFGENAAKLEQSFAERRLQIEQDFRNRRQAIQDDFEGEFAEADPFRRKIMEFNRREALKQLDEQEKQEKTALERQEEQERTALERQRDTALLILEERVAREQEILQREAEQKRARIEQEAAERTEALNREAAERAEALQREAEERRAAAQQQLADQVEANRRREEELRRSQAEEQAERDRAAAEARAKLQQRHAEELAQIAEQEQRKIQQAAEALVREEQNYSDRLAALRRSNGIEQAEIGQQLASIESARRRSYSTQLTDAEAFMDDLRRIMAGANGLGTNRAGDTLPPGPGRAGAASSPSITINQYGVPGGFAGAAQTARTARDALNGF